MVYKQKIVQISVAFALALAVTGARAQTAPTASEPNDATKTDLSTTIEIKPQDLGVANPSGFEFFKKRFIKIFTFNAAKKAKIDLDLANLTLLSARQAATQGDQIAAERLVDQYNRQISTLSQTVDNITAQLPADNTQVKSLLDRIAQTNVLTASVADRLSLQATGTFNQKLLKAKTEALKDVAKVLAKENLTAEELQKKLDEIGEKLADKETKTEKKFSKRIGLIEEISDAKDEAKIEDDDLKEAISKAKDDEIEKIAKDKGISDIVKEIEGSVEKHILVLQAVLAKVPDQAKPAVQAAIDRSIEKLNERAEKDAGEIDKVIKDKDEHAIEVKQEILKKLKDKTKQGSLKKALEDKEEDLKKEQETEQKENKETESKKTETTASGSSAPAKTASAPAAVSTTSSSAGETKSPTSSSDSQKSSTVGSGSSSSSTSETTEAKTYEIKYKDNKFDTSNVPSGGVNAGDSIKFKNDSDETIDIESNPHPTHTGLAALNIGSLAKGQEKTVKFEKSGTYGFHNHLNSSVTGSISVK